MQNAPRRLKLLEKRLASLPIDSDTMLFSELDGFVAGILVCPDVIMPSEWLPLVVVTVTFLTMLVTAGAVGSPGVLILPLQHEFGWSTSEISIALATRLLLPPPSPHRKPNRVVVTVAGLSITMHHLAC
jgi:hypothetical protein